jgi:methionyl-tRNA synthetase
LANCLTQSKRAALSEALRISRGQQVHRHFAPWFEIKNDKAAAAQTIYTALRTIDSLKLLFAPFVPFSSERLHTYLGYTQPLFGEQYIEEETDTLGTHTVLRYRPAQPGGRWQASQLPKGQALQPPAPLFKKLDEKVVVEEERTRLGKK